MTKVLTIANNKGGVGKTSTAQVIAAYFSQQGKRVLVLDMDPQCNFTSALLEVSYGEEGIEYLPYHPTEEGQRFDIANIFLEEPLAPYPTTLANVEIIPCKPVNIELDKQDESYIDAFVDFLHQEAVSDSYDLVIIDTPPAKGMLTSAAIRASTHVLIPMVLERKSVEGLLGMIQKVNRENEYKTPDRYSRIVGVLPNKVDARYRIHKDFLNQLNDHDEMGTVAQLMIPKAVLNQGPNLASFVIKERPALKEMDLRDASPTTPYAMSKSTDIYKEWTALGKFLAKEMELC